MKNTDSKNDASQKARAIRLFSISRLARNLLLTLMVACLASIARGQFAGTGAISGTVTDPLGAVIPNATVTATLVTQNTKTTRTSTSAGDYNITPLTPGLYIVTVTAKGFETYVQKNVTVDALQNVAINIKLPIGAVSDTVTVDEAPPVLDTTDAQVGGTMDNEMYSALPLLMGASGQFDQRRATDFAYLMPGVQNTYAASAGGNPTDATGAANGGNPGGGTSEIYLDGINLPEGDGVGDPRYTWSAIGVDAVNQFQVETAGYSAQYAGQGIQNYTIKSGGNQFHGSVYEFFRNTLLDAWQSNAKGVPILTGAPVPAGSTCSSAALSASTSWCALGGQKPKDIMNEYGIVLSGPLLKNKLFLFYNYGQYRQTAGPKATVQTIPTLAMLGYSNSQTALGYADFSGYAVAAATPVGKPQTCAIGSPTSPCYDIYDPATQTVPNCIGSACQRTLFANDQIPANRFSTAASYINKFMLPYSAQANQTTYANNITLGYPSGLSNWYQTGHLDYDISDKNRLSLVVAFGRQSVSSTGYGLAGGAKNSLPPPFNTNQFYAPQTNVDIIKDTYTINPHLVNQFAFAYGRYKSVDSNQDEKSIYSAAATGLLNTPPGQATIGFPGISFTGGADAPTNEGGYSWHGNVNNTYTIMDNVQAQYGKHNFTFGGQTVEVQYVSFTSTGASPLTYTFSGTQTEGYNSAGSAITTGSSFASYMLGAVSTSSVSISPEWQARWFSPSFWFQDDYKVTSKLTLNLGVRWDLFGSIHEERDQWTWLNPSGSNLNTGNYGTLSFAGGVAGNGPYTGLHSPSQMWYKNIGPRIGAAYSLDRKTVIRASYDVAYARGNWTAGGGAQKLPSQMGLVPSASAPGGLTNAPSFYWDASSCAGTSNGLARDGFTPCGWTGSTVTPAIVIAQQVAAGNMPVGANLAEFGTAETALEKNANNGSPGYFDSYLGSRSPEYINWTFGFQRQLTKNMSATVTYVGSQGHFINVAKANYKRNNGLPESMIGLAGYALPTATATTAAPCTGIGCQYSLLGQKATTTNLALAQGFGFNPPNPYTSTANYYASNSVYQYYEPFPQYSGVTDQTSFVGNENWNALEVSVNQRPAKGLNFMVNYTWSKSIDDLGTFRVGDNTRLDRSISAASQPQNLTSTVVYLLPIGKGHAFGEHGIYSAIVSNWSVSAIGTAHSGLPILATGTGCGGSAILNQCMPNVVPGQTARQYSYRKTKTGANISWDPNNANYIGNVQYINPNAFTVTNAGTCLTTGVGAYHTSTYQAYYVCNGPENYVPGNAARVAPLPGMWTQPTYNVDMALKRTFPIYHNIKLAFEVDMANVANHVVLSGPSASVAAGANATFGTVTAVANYPRATQAAARISW